MIWINIKELETRLINEEVTDRLAFTYLLFHLVYMSVLGHLGGDEDPLWAVWVQLLVSLGVMLWGMSRTFEINLKGDNRDYFKRFLSLSFVAGCRSVLLTAFIFATLNFLIDGIDSSFFQDPFKKAMDELVASACFIGYYYYLLLRSFRRINSGVEEG